MLQVLTCTYIREVTHKSNFQVLLTSSMHSPKRALFIHIPFKMLQVLA